VNTVNQEVWFPLLIIVSSDCKVAISIVWSADDSKYFVPYWLQPTVILSNVVTFSYKVLFLSQVDCIPTTTLRKSVQLGSHMKANMMRNITEGKTRPFYFLNIRFVYSMCRYLPIDFFSVLLLDSCGCNNNLQLLFIVGLKQMILWISLSVASQD